MPNNKNKAINIPGSLIPSTIAASNKKVADYNNYNNLVLLDKLSPPKNGQDRRMHLSPHSSCGSSTSSAFSSVISYCGTSCNSSTCSKKNPRPTSSGNCSTSDSTISSGSSISCESSLCSQNSSKYCSHSNISSSLSNTSYRTSLSNTSSISSSSSDEPIDESSLKRSISNNDSSDDQYSKKRITRSSASHSRNNSLNSTINTSNNSNNSNSTNNSNNTTKTNSTVMTAKVTRSTVNSLKASNCAEKNFTNEASKNNFETDEFIEKKKCMWNECNFIGNSVDIDNSLLDHIKSKHIFSQKDLRRFRCLWKGCSVYQKPASHFNWLERHVIDHIEKKPLMCIFDGCKRKFRTEEAREKHCQSHINSENISVTPGQSTSPTKARTHLLNNAKKALIQNIKNKNNSATTFKSAKPLPNYSQILKNLTKKRKTQALTAKKFKKAQFKDFLDNFSVKVLESKLKALNYQSGVCTFKAEIIGSQSNHVTNSEMFLVQWNPKNILKNEWVEKKNLHASKQITLSELPTQANRLNPFYRPHRFRTNRRK